MNILILIISCIAILIAVLLITALFVRKDYAIERTINIYKSKDEVFKYIKFLRNQDYFNKWVMTDPAMQKQFKGIDGTQGFNYAWDSEIKSAGKGEQEIKNIIEGEKLEIEIRFEKPFEGVATTQLITNSLSDNNTHVKWGMQGKSKYPLNLMNLFIDKILGKDLQVSLTNLKVILESNANQTH